MEENGIESPIYNKHILLGIDPRSPTTDFKRTPIVINASENELPKAIFNKNLEKVIQSELRTPKLRNDRVASNVRQPKLLDSSPIQPKPETYKRKSFVGLLETNIDFTETDIDVVFQEKCKGSLDSFKVITKIDVVQNQNVDPRSPTTDFLRTPIQIIKKIGEIDLNKDDYNSEPRTIELQDNLQDGVENICPEIDPPKLEESSEEQLFQDNEGDSPKSNPDENIQVSTVANNVQDETHEDSDVCESKLQKLMVGEKVTMNDDTFGSNNTIHEDIPNGTKSAPVTPPHMNIFEEEILHQKRHKSAPATPPCTNLDTKDLDTKIAHSIYEDDDIVVCPRVVQIKEYVERSPLRIWNGTESDRKKSGQKLKVSDKPRKSDGLCKIPIYKERVKKSNIQCENTPPRNMEIKKK